jgi:peptide deformylase
LPFCALGVYNWWNTSRNRAYDQNGTAFTLKRRLLAVCIQHEMDHLKGTVFIEQLSQLKQQRIRARLAKQQRKSA